MGTDWIVVVSSTASTVQATNTQNTSNAESYKNAIQNILSQVKTVPIAAKEKTNARISFETISVSSSSKISVSATESNIPNKNTKRKKLINQNIRKNKDKPSRVTIENRKEKNTLNIKKNRVKNKTKNKTRQLSKSVINTILFLKSCKKYLSPEMLNLVRTHLIYNKSKAKRIKVNKNYRKFATNLNGISQKAFKFVADKLKLPDQNYIKDRF